MDEELGILHPSSLQFASRVAGTPVPLSNASELDRASGTLDNIPKDENAESIVIVDGASRALKSSFYMASTSRESLDSFASMVFTPSPSSEF